MFHLYLKIIKDYWKSTTWFSIGMGLIGIYVISVYPSFEKSSDEFNKVIGNLPEAIKIVIGEGSMSSIEGFMNLEIFQLFAPIVYQFMLLQKELALSQVKRNPILSINYYLYQYREFL